MAHPEYGMGPQRGRVALLCAYVHSGLVECAVWHDRISYMRKVDDMMQAAECFGFVRVAAKERPIMGPSGGDHSEEMEHYNVRANEAIKLARSATYIQYA